MAELRNPTASRWDWDRHLRPYGVYFPRGITCADVDSETEINGHFLVLEGKRTGQTLSNGQRYTMDARVRDGRTVIIVYGDPDEGRIDFLQHWPAEKVAGSWQQLHGVFVEWSIWAGRTHGHPSAFVADFNPKVPEPATNGWEDIPF